MAGSITKWRYPTILSDPYLSTIPSHRNHVSSALEEDNLTPSVTQRFHCVIWPEFYNRISNRIQRLNGMRNDLAHRGNTHSDIVHH